MKQCTFWSILAAAAVGLALLAGSGAMAQAPASAPATSPTTAAAPAAGIDAGLAAASARPRPHRPNEHLRRPAGQLPLGVGGPPARQPEL